MKKRINFNPLLFIALFVLFLGFFTVSSFAFIKEEMKAIEKVDEQLKQETQIASEQISRPAMEYTADKSRDPFRSIIVNTDEAGRGKSTGSERPLPTLKVQGIIWGGRFPQAIINNKVLKVGDSIEEAKIISIDKDGVSLFFSGRKYDLASPATGGESVSKKTGGQNENKL